MTTLSRSLKFGVCALALAAVFASAPSMAGTKSSAASSNTLGVQAGGVNANVDTGLSLGTQTNANTNATGNAAANAQAETMTNTNTQAGLAANTRIGAQDAAPQDMGARYGFNNRAHANSDNRVGASYGND